MNKKKFKFILLNILWLGIIFTAIYLIIRESEGYGLWGWMALSIAIVMLLLYGLIQFGQSKYSPIKNSAQKMGDWLTLILISALIVLLSLSGINSLLNRNYLTALILFFVISICIRIIRDFMKDMKKRNKSVSKD